MIIEISGKKVGLKFNRFCIEAMGKMPFFQNFVKTGKKDVAGINTFGFATCLIYQAYRGWCFVKQMDEELTLEDVSDWVDLSLTNPEIEKQITDIIAEYEASELHKLGQKKSEVNHQLAENEK